MFIGEEGLDVTAAVGNFTQIAWFVSGANPWADAPNYIVAVGNPTTFYIAPADFVGRTGNWFVWDGGITLGVVAINVVAVASGRAVLADVSQINVSQV